MSPREAPSVFTNAVYYPNYMIYKSQPPSSLQLNLISHVFYSFANIQENGEVELSDELADSQLPVDGCLGCLGSFAMMKERWPHLKILLSIGGAAAGERFVDIASHHLKRDRLAFTCRVLVEKYRFDGIDVNWQGPSNEEQRVNFTALISQLRQHLPINEFLLSAAFPAGEWALRWVDLPRVQQQLDFINLMAYDFCGPWNNTAGYHSQLYSPDASKSSDDETAKLSGDAAVQYCLSCGVRPGKILLGIPAYGRMFPGAHGHGQASQASSAEGEEGIFEYRDLPRPGAEEFVDAECVSAFSANQEAGFISYDNPATVTRKAEYVRNNKLAGVFFWTGTGDVPSGDRSLILASYRALHPEYLD